ncbi:MAG: protoglobin domain-containing protein [Myxococcota bacterium]
MSDALTELKTWVRYTADDEARLAACAELIEPHVPRIIDRFYEEILRHPGSSSVIDGPDQVARLKTSLRGWLNEVFRGPHDEAYAHRRRAIGHRHVQVGLPNRYMVMAMHLVETEVGQVLRASLEDPLPALDSVQKVCCIDLALMTGTFVESREQLQLDTLHSLLVEHLRVAVLLVGADGNVRSATRASGLVIAGGDVMGRPWTEALPTGLLEASSLERHVERGLAHRREVTLPRVDVSQDGGLRSFRVHVVPLEHELARFLIQIEELTDAVELEARLRRSEALAQLGTLSAAVAHELRNPLAGISGALQVITRTIDPDSAHYRILVKVESEVHRLNDLVTDLLAFARPGTATLQTVDLAQLVDEVVELVVPAHPRVHVDVGGRGLAQADPNLVRQILHNLVRNAMDAMGGEGTLKIDIEPGRIVVQDSGPGIPKDRWVSSFEPFVTTKTRGTGLGLAISARSADAMSATLRLKEGPMSGACFELCLLDRPAPISS